MPGKNFVQRVPHQMQDPWVIMSDLTWHKKLISNRWEMHGDALFVKHHSWISHLIHSFPLFSHCHVSRDFQRRDEATTHAACSATMIATKDWTTASCVRQILGMESVCVWVFPTATWNFSPEKSMNSHSNFGVLGLLERHFDCAAWVNHLKEMRDEVIHSACAAEEREKVKEQKLEEIQKASSFHLQKVRDH